MQEDAQIEAWGVLEIRTPGEQKHELRLSGEAITIGRDRENAVVLDDDHVSRRHARIERDDAGCRIVDLGSANGTRVATEELEPRVPHALSDGDSATIGPFALTLHFTPERIAAAPDTPTGTGANGVVCYSLRHILPAALLCCHLASYPPSDYQTYRCYPAAGRTRPRLPSPGPI